jgi:hypothetical protein
VEITTAASAAPREVYCAGGIDIARRQFDSDCATELAAELEAAEHCLEQEHSVE